MSEADYRREERRFRPRVARAHLRSFERLAASIDEKELELALVSGDPRRVMSLFSDPVMERHNQPIVAILSDAYKRMGRHGFADAEELSEEG